MSPASSKTFRAIRHILPQQPKHWVGNGFNVYPVFADLAFTNELSPFLMFDYAAPKEFTPILNGRRRGVGQHPHRGFETVTIAFQGEVEHQDSVGNQDVIESGDVQWMTAGRGIIHEEFHSDKFSYQGGTFEMCQLWVNLPKEHKMTPPRYQPILNKNIPVVSLSTVGSDDGDQKDKAATVRVIAGELDGVKGPANTFSPVELWDLQIPKINSVVDLPFADGHNCIVFCREGSFEIIVGDNEKKSSKAVGPQAVALMEQSGDIVRIKATAENTSVLIMGGKPINEPIAARGPFVMNTWDEIQKANIVYRSGEFGT